MKNFLILTTVSLLFNLNLALADNNYNQSTNNQSTAVINDSPNLQIENVNGQIRFSLTNKVKVVMGDGSNTGAWNPEEIKQPELLELKKNLVNESIKNYCRNSNPEPSELRLANKFKEMSLVAEGTSLEVSLTALLPSDLKCLQEEMQK